MYKKIIIMLSCTLSSGCFNSGNQTSDQNQKVSAVVKDCPELLPPGIQEELEFEIIGNTVFLTGAASQDNIVFQDISATPGILGITQEGKKIKLNNRNESNSHQYAVLGCFFNGKQIFKQRMLLPSNKTPVSYVLKNLDSVDEYSALVSPGPISKKSSESELGSVYLSVMSLALDEDKKYAGDLVAKTNKKLTEIIHGNSKASEEHYSDLQDFDEKATIKQKKQLIEKFIGDHLDDGKIKRFDDIFEELSKAGIKSKLQSLSSSEILSDKKKKTFSISTKQPETIKDTSTVDDPHIVFGYLPAEDTLTVVQSLKPETNLIGVSKSVFAHYKPQSSDNEDLSVNNSSVSPSSTPISILEKSIYSTPDAMISSSHQNTMKEKQELLSSDISNSPSNRPSEGDASMKNDPELISSSDSLSSKVITTMETTGVNKTSNTGEDPVVLELRDSSSFAYKVLNAIKSEKPLNNIYGAGFLTAMPENMNTNLIDNLMTLQQTLNSLRTLASTKGHEIEITHDNLTHIDTIIQEIEKKITAFRNTSSQIKKLENPFFEQEKKSEPQRVDVKAQKKAYPEEKRKEIERQKQLQLQEQEAKKQKLQEARQRLNLNVPQAGNDQADISAYLKKLQQESEKQKPVVGPGGIPPPPGMGVPPPPGMGVPPPPGMGGVPAIGANQQMMVAKTDLLAIAYQSQLYQKITKGGQFDMGPLAEFVFLRFIKNKLHLENYELIKAQQEKFSKIFTKDVTALDKFNSKNSFFKAMFQALLFVRDKENLHDRIKIKSVEEMEVITGLILKPLYIDFIKTLEAMVPADEKHEFKVDAYTEKDLNDKEFLSKG